MSLQVALVPFKASAVKEIPFHGGYLLTESQLADHYLWLLGHWPGQADLRNATFGGKSVAQWQSTRLTCTGSWVQSLLPPFKKKKEMQCITET